jgi:hypothetical protein
MHQSLYAETSQAILALVYPQMCLFALPGPLLQGQSVDGPNVTCHCLAHQSVQPWSHQTVLYANYSLAAPVASLMHERIGSRTYSSPAKAQ